jgi:glycosyltransferase involved in cell wall biosynthesis
LRQNRRLLYLFTNNYPFKGYEYFIDNEIQYLSNEFDEIRIFPYPENNNTESYFKIPGNVIVRIMEVDNSKSIRKILLSNLIQILYWWIYEFIHSKHRFKYVIQFKWNWNRLVGIIKISDSLKKEGIPENAILYSYWFNEWAEVLAWSKGSWLKNIFASRAHGYDFDEAQMTRGYHPFRYVVFNQIKKVFQISEYGKSYMKNQGLNDSKIEVIRLGVSDLGLGAIPQKKYIIVTCSNLHPVKRLELIPDILNHLTVAYKWVHFGGGYYEEETLSQIRKKIPSEHFEYRGITLNADILDFYSKSGADVVMNVSKLEGIPVSLMEAISFGIPITGCNTCGVPEIANENTGLLFDVQFDPQKVATQLQSLLLEKSRNPEFRKGVREYYLKNYKDEDNFPRFINQLKKQSV